MRCGQCKQVFKVQENLVEYSATKSTQVGTPPSLKPAIQDHEQDTMINISTSNSQPDKDLSPDVTQLNLVSTDRYIEEISRKTKQAIIPIEPVDVLGDKENISERSEDTEQALAQNSLTYETEENIPLLLRDSFLALETDKRSKLRIILSLIILLMLTLVVLSQVAMFKGFELSQQYPHLGPWISEICKHLPCHYTGRRDTNKIQLISRDIRLHPKIKGALLVNGVIVNKAEFYQPFPDFTVTLSNLTGTVVAERRFSPQDYLGQMDKKFILMKPDTPIHIALEVLDPGKEAINFEFTFL